MVFSARDLWTAFHGVVLGGTFLLSFAGVLLALWGFDVRVLTLDGLRSRLRLLKVGTVAMAAVSWVTVLTGTFLIYPWYRNESSGDVTKDMSARSYLLAEPALRSLHAFGMEWKEHVAWFSPMLATVVAFAVLYYGSQLAEQRKLRTIVTCVFILSFVCAAIAGLLGIALNKAAPVR
jgi:hypothetical protein